MIALILLEWFWATSAGAFARGGRQYRRCPLCRAKVRRTPNAYGHAMACTACAWSA